MVWKDQWGARRKLFQELALRMGWRWGSLKLESYFNSQWKHCNSEKDYQSSYAANMKKLNLVAWDQSKNEQCSLFLLVLRQHGNMKRPLTTRQKIRILVSALPPMTLVRHLAWVSASSCIRQRESTPPIQYCLCHTGICTCSEICYIYRKQSLKTVGIG